MQNNYKHRYDEAMKLLESRPVVESHLMILEHLEDERKRCAQAYEILLTLAEAGYLQAQYSLAKHLSLLRFSKRNKDFKINFKKDRVQAFYWFQKAAEQNYVPALKDIGHMLIAGEGVDKNVEAGFQYLIKAANQKDTSAYYCLGLYYHLGQGGEINHEKAKEWFILAADKNYEHKDFAFAMLGLIYEQGLGVNKDINMALNYYEKAIEQNNNIAILNSARLYKEGKEIGQDYKKAYDLYSKLTDTYDTKIQLEAVMQIAHYLEFGFGVKQNLIWALDWYKKAQQILIKHPATITDPELLVRMNESIERVNEKLS